MLRTTSYSDRKKLWNALVSELDYFKRLLPLVWDSDGIIKKSSRNKFHYHRGKEYKIKDFSKDRKIHNFLNFIAKKYSGDLYAVIEAFQKCQRYQVSKIIVKIQLIIS